MRLEFHAELFNVLNHTQFRTTGDLADDVLSPGSFGQYLSADDPCIVQLALKLTV
jgi:hypothetical protein